MVYIGTKLKAFVAMKPLRLHVVIFPIAQDANIDPFGEENGPVKSASDCTISDTLSPKIRRRYGVVSFLGDTKIIVAIVDDATKETEEVATARTNLAGGPIFVECYSCFSSRERVL